MSSDFENIVVYVDNWLKILLLLAYAKTPSPMLPYTQNVSVELKVHEIGSDAIGLFRLPAAASVDDVCTLVASPPSYNCAIGGGGVTPLDQSSWLIIGGVQKDTPPEGPDLNSGESGRYPHRHRAVNPPIRPPRGCLGAVPGRGGVGPVGVWARTPRSPAWPDARPGASCG